jgi:hypothetical protein
MDGLPVPPPAHIATVLALVAGTATGIATFALAGAAAPEPASVAGDRSLEAVHVPQLLTAPGERVRLRFDAFCASGDPNDGEADCSPTGSVFVRSGSRAPLEIPLAAAEDAGGNYLVADVPDDVASDGSGFSYYAVLHDGEATAVLPPGGEAAPYTSVPMERAVRIDLGTHSFGAGRRPNARVASASWGNGRDDVGLEQGRTQGPIGASGFDVDAAGRVYVLDEAHHRVLEWARSSIRPSRVAVPVSGTIGDLSVGSDGSLYVLETVGEPTGRPLVRRFDDGGRELESIELAEQTASQIRNGPDGPIVLQQPAQQWMPVIPGGVPAGRSEQRRLARAARPLVGGRELTVFRTGDELRVALTNGSGVRRGWRIVSASSLAEVQLAEPLGNRVVVVVRVYADDRDEFIALVLDDRGLVRQFAIAPNDWAETAPLGRFRLAGKALYQLGSSPNGVFVDRFDLEVKP